MYIDEIQYTYKSCKLVLMKSIHKNKGCILEDPKLTTVNQNRIHVKPKHVKISFYKQ